MSYIHIFLVSLLISKKILSQNIEECSNILDCINCTLFPGCEWLNKSCINSTNWDYNETLMESDNSTILFHDLKLIKNICFENKPPYVPEENHKINEISDEYCGDNLIILSYDLLLNGLEIKLKNNSGLYGTPNLLCEYILTHGNDRIDADIYINRSLSNYFLLFYSDDMDQSLKIDYSSTLSMYKLSFISVSFLFYSNQTFETPPFIIYIKIDQPEEESELLTYFFLAIMIVLILLSIGGIIFIRKCSIVFNLEKLKKNDKDEIIENKGNLSVINENNLEENSKNEIEVGVHEFNKIKEQNEESIKESSKNLNN